MLPTTQNGTAACPRAFFHPPLFKSICPARPIFARFNFLLALFLCNHLPGFSVSVPCAFGHLVLVSSTTTITFNFDLVHP
jgi:hypothetical protein